MSIYLGDPQISIGYYIWKSMIPSLLGNVVGGALLVGTLYWYLNLTSEPPVLVDGVGYGGQRPLEGRSVQASSHDGRASSESKKENPEDMV
jgi:hypothetical protein